MIDLTRLGTKFIFHGRLLNHEKDYVSCIDSFIERMIKADPERCRRKRPFQEGYDQSLRQFYVKTTARTPSEPTSLVLKGVVSNLRHWCANHMSKSIFNPTANVFKDNPRSKPKMLAERQLRLLAKRIKSNPNQRLVECDKGMGFCVIAP